MSFSAPDHAADGPVYYYLFSPADLRPVITKSGNIDVSATDATPTANNLTGSASLIARHPQPGLWEIDVMQGATTDGTRFSQTVTGTVAYNQVGAFTRHGLPGSTSKTIASGASVPITVTVTNTTNHVGYFELQPSGKDITGGNTATPQKLAAEATGTLTATLSPTAAAGTKVHGTLSVIDSTVGGLRSPPSGSRSPSPTSTISPTPTRVGAGSAADPTVQDGPRPRLERWRGLRCWAGAGSRRGTGGARGPCAPLRRRISILRVRAERLISRITISDGR